ncbi:hypothetical protein AAG570_010148 [Ranatra chinensis]|uniref:G domain-containing protein n=1 Tax=Ranatra chinensis TaxID=642074 RepID=A0ABD0YLQ3_9HEMI
MFIRKLSNVTCGCKKVFNNYPYLSSVNYCFYNELFVGQRKGLFLNHLKLFNFSRRQLTTTAAENEISESISHKILYNCLIHRVSYIEKKKLEIAANAAKEISNKKISRIPLTLKYFVDYDLKTTDQKDTNVESSETELINLPFSIKVTDLSSIDHSLPDKEENITEHESVEDVESARPVVYDIISDFPLRGRSWMNDYEKYSDVDLDAQELDGWQLDYGTSDISVPVSKVPCGGCGALLHCQDASIPGYLPKEIFKECNEKDLRGLTCQRCHFIKNYNTALSVSVDPDSYPKLLSKIKNERALVILMVDLTDFPCSIWPGILDIIGRKRPVFVVGNKVDLLWGDCKGWMDHTKKQLLSSFPRETNIQHVCLISAKTGFGVEELINKLHTYWQYKGDVYLVGCTNVGKSSLFNALLQSDYCKVKAVDLVQRATIAPWPGTTLNLLKFPILRPEGWRLYLRTQRLKRDKENFFAEKMLKREQIKAQKIKPKEPPQLIGQIGRTFQASLTQDQVTEADTFSVPNRNHLRAVHPPGSGLDPNDPDLVQSRWVYDTPGVLHKDQFLDLLTTEELKLTIPKKIILPRSFIMKPGWTIFIGGIARLDYTRGAKSVRLTVFASNGLPITVCTTENAENVYNSLIGTQFMAVPQGGQARLEKWPHLRPGLPINVCGISWKESCLDIVLSSAGWIAITPGPKDFCKFQAWTPFSRGIHIRNPSLLPHAISLRGKRRAKTPSYHRPKVLPNY